MMPLGGAVGNHLGIWHSNNHTGDQNKLFPQTAAAALSHDTAMTWRAALERMAPADVQDADAVGAAALHEASHACGAVTQTAFDARPR